MLTQRQQEGFSILKDRYGLEGVIQCLDLCIEMLFYLEEGAFTRREIQEVVCVVRDLTVILENGTLQ